MSNRATTFLVLLVASTFSNTGVTVGFSFGTNRVVRSIAHATLLLLASTFLVLLVALAFGQTAVTVGFSFGADRLVHLVALAVLLVASSGAQRADAIKLATIVVLCAFAGSSALFAIAVFDNATDWVSKDRVSAPEISARGSSSPFTLGTI